MEMPGHGGPGDDTVLLYGHLDKQPEMTGWREGLVAVEPVREGDKLYGRGGADDGYAAFASLAALRLLHEQKRPARALRRPHRGGRGERQPRPARVHRRARARASASRALVVCLDSGCGELRRSSGRRRRCAASSGGTLRVDVLTEGVHSGAGERHGAVELPRHPPAPLAHRGRGRRAGARSTRSTSTIPAARARAGRRPRPRCSATRCSTRSPGSPARSPVTSDVAELHPQPHLAPGARRSPAPRACPPLAQRGQRPAPVHGAEALACASRRASIPQRAAAALKDALEKDPPYGARVALRGRAAPPPAGTRPPLAPWLEAATSAASRAFFGKPAMSMGEGGTIPFMAMLGEKFPEAQFLITGVLGPAVERARARTSSCTSPTGKKLTCCVASVVAAHFARR